MNSDPYEVLHLGHMDMHWHADILFWQHTNSVHALLTPGYPNHTSAAACLVPSKACMSCVRHLHVSTRPAHQHGDRERQDIMTIPLCQIRRSIGA